jgi:ATP-dependent helicase HrpA
VNVTFPSLPIAAHVEELTAAIKAHQVVVVAGETGSGKTTQLPKICLLAGRKRIGHTQPRRIAARTVAERIASEMGEPLGQTVGYQVRFVQQTSQQTQIKLMTDGIMLAEIAQDRMLRRYDTIIIDEAHERSLNIDFLLGYLKYLVTKRPELRVIITSATIDTEAFARHFNAPIIQIEGRTYPVSVEYADAEALADDPNDAIAAAVADLSRRVDGDILVFCAGERQIKDAADAVNGLKLRDTEVVPLYARLPAAKQHEVFQPHRGRRVVLATNIAETSVTVPGIRAVVDTGVARISRYDTRSKVQRLPIEPISRASADQRAGRCGRLGPGICVRLYTADDYASRPEYTPPEILRTSLAAVILQMAWARLGPIDGFGFIDRPDAKQISDGLKLLEELGAIVVKRTRRTQPELTEVGRHLARLPIDPRLGRMLVEAQRLGVLREVQAIVAGLSIIDVREYPAEARELATASHRRFNAPTETESPKTEPSDILAVLRLWQYLRGKRKALSSSAFRRLCRDEYFNYLRTREWQELYTQLKQICDEIGLERGHRHPDGAEADRIHIAVLSGLLSQLGVLDTRTPTPTGRRQPIPEYRGAHGSSFRLARDSAVKRAELVAAVEIVETSHRYAHTVLPAEPEWVAEVGAHLLKHRYSEPHWAASRGECVADDAVTLYGIQIFERQVVSYGGIDPILAREVFIRSGLVEGDLRDFRHRFWHHNNRVIAEARELEDQARRALVDEQALFAFYDARIPPGIVSVAHFNSWWKREQRQNPHLLDFQLDELVEDFDAEEYPQSWTVGAVDYPIAYAFEPGASDDGITVQIDIGQLNEVDPAAFTWQIPAFRVQLATELIRKLPKQYRAQLVPAPDTAAAAVAMLEPRVGQPFIAALTEAIASVKGIRIPLDAWQPTAIPEFLKVHFEVLDGERVIAGDDLAEIRQRLAPKVAKQLNRAASRFVHPGATSWVFGTLPLQTPGNGWLALADQGKSVAVKVFDAELSAQRAQLAGLRRLVVLNSPDTTNYVIAYLSNPDKLALALSPYHGVPALLADARLVAAAGEVDAPAVRDESAFADLLRRARPDAAKRHLELVRLAARTLRNYGEVQKLLPAAPKETAADIRVQLDNLIFDGFLRATSQPWLGRLPVYLEAMLQRLRAAAENPYRDATRAEPVLELEDEYARFLKTKPSPLADEILEIGWLIEEFRISVFAQRLGTLRPVSAKRIRALL